MEILALDINFELVNLVVPSVVMWNRKYYEFGDFLIEIPYHQYSKQMKYIYTKDRTEVGMVQKVSYQEQGMNKTVQLSGYFMEKVLDDKVVYPTFYGNGLLANELRMMIEGYKSDLPFTVANGQGMGARVQFQVTGDELGTKTREMLQTQEMSYRMNYDYALNDFQLEFYMGLDRTQSQLDNNYVTFSTSWKNLSNVIAEQDESNYKNYAIVSGEGEAEERIVVEVDLSDGGYKKVLYVDARDMQYNADEQTMVEYEGSLYQRGVEKLMDYQKIENVEFFPLENSYTYLIDYDLGTKCDIIINDIELVMEARIIAIYEVFKDGAHTIELEFGNKVLSKVEKLERMIQ